MKHEIYLRSHTRILGEKSEKEGSTRPSSALRYVLILDTETTIDAKQNLNFGVYQFCEADMDGRFLCLEEGLFYSDDLSTAQLEVLRKYVQNQNRKRTCVKRLNLKLYGRSAFVEKVVYVAIQSNAAVTGEYLRH